jgi:RhtB (resistance to homoserine/threonine) family protein
MLAFILVVLVLFLIPGPAVLLTVSQSLKGGRKAGIYTGIGIAVADLIHTLAAVLGLSAILMTSALAFEIVKYLGAAYLIYIGISSIFEKRSNEQRPVVQKKSPSLSFRQAILVELLNPKTALFFLAFLPQFVRPDGPPVVMQLLTLGLTFVIMSILYTSLIAMLASYVAGWLQKRSMATTWQNKFVGIIYIGLGIQLALQNK